MLPSYEQCNEIVKRNSSFVRKEEVVGGTRIVQFNYFLAQYQDFAKYDALELRGLTFLERSDGTWERNLMLHKFYRLNQSVGYLYEDVKNKKIIRVQNKFDGSLIRFVRLNDGTVVAKTKFSFDGEQAVAANKLYAQNPDLREFVDWSLGKKYAALFEYVSPENQVVLQYSKSELVLLQVRDESTGGYINPVKTFEAFGLPVASEEEIKSLDDYIEWAKTAEKIEGVVITFSDGQMLKIKTAQYDALHRTMTETVKRENDIVACVLEDVVDDLISQIPIENVEMRAKIEHIAKIITDFVNVEAERVYYLVFCEYHNDRRRFAIANKADRLFGIIMKLVDDCRHEYAIQLVKEYVAKQTRTLDAARVFLNALDRKAQKN